MEDEKELSGQESIELIHSMISRAHDKLHDNGFLYLVWGWLVFVASVACYLLVEFDKPNLSGLPWAILMPAGGIISGVYGWRQGKKRRVKTYTEEVLDYVSFSFLICLFITLIFVSNSTGGWGLAYPLIIMIYGMWLFSSGGILRFKPLMIGGLLNWCISIGSFFIHTHHVILMVSLAVLVGYIIPGYMLQAAYKKQNEVI